MLSGIRESKPNSPRHALLVGLLLALSAAASSEARTLTVPGQYPTIGAALAEAVAGDLVLVACGRYRERDLDVGPGVRLWSGTLQPDCTIIDAGRRGRVFALSRADSATAIVGFTLLNGRAVGTGRAGRGGAVIVEGGAPRISNCRIRNSEAVQGGGLHVGRDAAPRLADCTFETNVAREAGGAIHWAGRRDGLVTKLRCDENEALAGGAVFVDDNVGLRFEAVTFTGNMAANAGGAVVARSARPRFTDCVFDRNHAGLGGGAVVSLDGACEFTRCTFYGNGAEYLGAAVATRDASPLLDHCILAFQELTTFAAEGEGGPRLVGCDVFGNHGGDWVGVIADQADQRGNFSVDPLFCGPSVGNFSVAGDSECLAGPTTTGRTGRVGAGGRGCAESEPHVPVESASVARSR